MLVTPSNSTRTVSPATAITNHMKVRRRENPGRNNWIAFHHEPHTDSGRSRSGMVCIHGSVGSGHPIRAIDSPGGGGYGDPLRRDPERVLADVREGFVAPEAAEGITAS